MGEVKVVSPNKDDVGGNYALKKICKNKLEATIAVDFSGGNAYNPALSLDLFDKTKSCLEQVGPYLKSPSVCILSSCQWIEFHYRQSVLDTMACQPSITSFRGISMGTLVPR